MSSDERLAVAAERIASALERLAPPPAEPIDFDAAEAFVWRPGRLSAFGAPPADRLDPVAKVAGVDIDLLVGVDRAREQLLENTRRFARGLPANNALLWGARGMGKSSLVKAAHRAVNAEGGRLRLIEILREDLPTLDRLLTLIRSADTRVLLFCDDLSFEKDDAHYKALKAVLDGGVEGRPANAIVYATSNRRHLMPRDMIENERQVGLHPGEAVEEKVSLSDRFGLWLGFHGCGQDQYLEMVAGYAAAYRLDVAPERLRAEAIEWRQTRGSASGRVAWQFIQDLSGRLGRRLERSDEAAGR
ncbi:MAG: ATP-binding protein [Neomegalonema sp.]|nr:ATP-binding protein [Neomegalonema sp.]